jgi:hypothetical protein
MSLKIDRSGLDKLIKNAKELDGTHQVQLSELMNSSFIAAHSQFSDLDSLITASGFKVESAADFAAIPDDEWDVFIAHNTDFADWAEMQESAAAAFVRAKLNKGL